MLQLFPIQQAVELPIYHPLDLPRLSDRPHALLNMIGTLDGKALVEGRVQNVGDRTDQYLMRVLRTQVDAVLNGAETLRANQLNFKILPELANARRARGQRDRLYGIVVSKSLDLPLDNRFFRNPAHDPIVVTCASAPKDRRERIAEVATVIEVGDDQVDLSQALRLLKTRFAIQALLSEGGPTINYAMLQAGLIDELFLTLAPKIEGGRDTLTIVEGPTGFAADATPHFTLCSAYLDPDPASNGLFLRYQRRANVE